MPRLYLIVLCLLIAGCTSEAQQPKSMIVPASNAKQYKDKVCTIEMNVLASKAEVDRAVHFLDSELDYKDPRNFAIKIEGAGLERFVSAGIENPSEYFKGKTIRVTGKVIFDEDQYLMLANEPSQIQVVP